MGKDFISVIGIEKLIRDKKMGEIHHKREIKSNPGHIVSVLVSGDKKRKEDEKEHGGPSHHQKINFLS